MFQKENIWIQGKVMVWPLLAIVGLIFPAECHAAHETRVSSFNLPVIVVEAREGKTLPGGFLKENSSIGITGKQNVMDAPYTVATVGQKSIKTFTSPAEGITGALSLNPSVRVDLCGVYTDISIRGIYANGHNAYVNGIPGLLGMESIPFYWVDNATIISGPNLGVNGTPLSEAAGGSVNYQSKKATNKDITEMKLGYRGGKAFEEAIDVGRRYGKEKQFGIRFTANNIHGEDSIEDDRFFQQQLFANIDQTGKNAKTNLLLGYAHTDHKGGAGGFYSFRKGVTALPSAPDASRLYKPGWFYNEYENWIAALNHEQKLGEHASCYVHAGYHKENWFGFIDADPEVLDDAGNFELNPSNYPIVFSRKYLGAGIKGDFMIGKIKNEYLLGVDKDWSMSGGGENPLYSVTLSGNLYRHNHWANPGAPIYYKAAYSYKSEMTGWHIVNTSKALDDRLQVTLGLHGHKAKSMPKGKEIQKSDVSCPTFAISYKVNPNVTVYGGHTESFGMGRMVSTTKGYINGGEMLPPVKTKQNEIGVKVKTGNFLNTLSFFKINKASYIEKDTGHGILYTRDGDQENKGIEWSTTGNLSKKLDLIGGIMYLDAKKIKTSKSLYDGYRVNGAAKWSGTLGTVYHANKSWDVLGRVLYAGSSTIQDGRLAVPSYTRFDLGTLYKTKISNNPVTIQAMCHNIMGKDYWIARSGSNSLCLAAPRTFTISANFEF